MERTSGCGTPPKKNFLSLETCWSLEHSCYEYTMLVRIYFTFLLLHFRDLKWPMFFFLFFFFLAPFSTAEVSESWTVLLGSLQAVNEASGHVWFRPYKRLCLQWAIPGPMRHWFSGFTQRNGVPLVLLHTFAIPCNILHMLTLQLTIVHTLWEVCLCFWIVRMESCATNRPKALKQ